MTSHSPGDVLPTDYKDLVALVQGMAERARSRPRSPDLIAKAAVVQLPLWGEEIRCAPNEVLRSALFNAKNRNQPRRYFKNEVIGIIGQSASISYTGEELRQNDESVWLQLIHLAKSVPLGQPVEFTAYSLVQALRLTKSKPNARHIERLCESLRRMQATSLTVYSKRLTRGVSLSMIPKFEWQDEVTGARLPKWRVFIAPELVELFGDVHFTHLQWAQRLALPSGLATWMHGYLASHRKPLPVKLSTLQRGSGCVTETPRKFKQLASIALSELKRVGFLLSSEVRGELIHVERA
jgi:hypothetical protein